ncbi:acyl-CoA thioesterase [uncultured Cytophaga sp.]|uniref:acyl-CoA thioesterase n=1 Tax=uncultured Cytophaga sp. TaxID=160238 RepID=UPI00262D3FB3|nr:acyl-CoA thioesterase [uncultured Cytophaga sp.]
MKTISHISEVVVRFSEVDSLLIVWHGHYVRYFEDAREAFGLAYGIHYLDVHRAGYSTPIVKVHCDYKRSLKYGDTAVIEATYFDSDAAKLIFNFVIRNKSNNEIIATGETVQVFLDSNKELCLLIPPFFTDWKKKNGIQ